MTGSDKHGRAQRTSDQARHIGRLLPTIGIVLFALPLLWNGPNPVRLSLVMIYLFVVWGMLIAVAAGVHWLNRNAPNAQEDE